MKNDCKAHRDQLLDAALTGVLARELQEHLHGCRSCAEELSAMRSRRERLDALLPLVAQEAEPSPEFHVRVLAAAKAVSAAERATPRRTWNLAGLARIKIAAVLVPAMILAMLLISLTLYWRVLPQRQIELAAAQKLAAWRAPSDIFLETPGRDFLRTTPKLGGSYLPIPPQNIPAKIHKETHQEK